MTSLRKKNHLWDIKREEFCEEYKQSLVNYIQECYKIQPFGILNMIYKKLFDYLISTGIFDNKLTLYPKFVFEP